MHNPNLQENISFQYDEELLFLVGDWYHRASSDVLANYMSRTSTGIEVRLRCDFTYSISADFLM